MADMNAIIARPLVYVPRLDRGGIFEIVTTGKVVAPRGPNPTVDFGVNPYQWMSLPAEGIILWKVRHPVTEDEANLPATVILPTGVSTTTPVSMTGSGVTVNKTPVVDKVGSQTSGQDINAPVGTSTTAAGAYTEHLVYYNKCTGVFRLLGQTATPAPTPVEQ